MNKSAFASAAAILMLVTQPCLAAEDMRQPSSMQQRIGTWAGGSIRVPLGVGPRGLTARPEARLQLGFTRNFRSDVGANPQGNLHVAAFELGASRKGGAAFYMAGRPVGEFRQKLGMNTGTAIAIGGGVLLVALAIAFATTKPVPDGFLCGNSC